MLRTLEKPASLDTQSMRVGLALLATYTIWGSTYLALKYAVETMPPFLMSGIRFLIAGTVLFFMLWLRGEAVPTRIQWRNSLIVGGLLLGGGMGGVAFAEQWVDSGIAALGVAIIPIWAVLFSGLREGWPTRIQIVGLLVGFAGVVMLNAGGGMWVKPIGAVALILAPMSWAFGSIISRRMDLPHGLMSSAASMFCGGLVLTAMGLLTGEKFSETPSQASLLSMLYLIVFGSLIGYTAYNYLLRNAKPIIATSYAYVNPV
ncbi:MAG: drug/metabolite exporter YedA, partial [Anaerolineae bacterium]|nr:drug/metabolite exporter YedA [Anaerolineae bacterium]